MSMRRVFQSVLLMSAVACVVSFTSYAQRVDDPVGDFLPSYVGPHNGDLDVVSAEVTFTGSEFVSTGTMAGLIGFTEDAFYIWGVDRGLGSETADFVKLGYPDIVSDSLVRFEPFGESRVFDIVADRRTPIPESSITVEGNTVSVRVPASWLPQMTDIPREQYVWNLWPRWGGIPFSDPQISDFAPDKNNAPVTVAK